MNDTIEGSGAVHLSTIKEPLFYTFCVLSSLVLVFDIACLVFFVIFRNRKVVKVTSPKLNYLLVTAVFFLCVSVILYPFPTTSETALRFLCPIRALSIGFLGSDVYFSVLLVKLCRIYYVFRKPTAKKRVITDTHLFLGALVVMIPDLIVYMVFVPLEIAVPDIGTERNEEEPFVLNEMGELEENYFLSCGASKFFLARTVLSACYKIALQGTTLVLAILSRKVVVPALDDAKYVMANAYVATILSVIVLLTSWTLGNYPNSYASVYATSSVIGGLTFVSLLFVPKMVLLYRDPSGKKMFQSTDIDLSPRIPVMDSLTLPRDSSNGFNLSASLSFSMTSSLPTQTTATKAGFLRAESSP